jgi:hypothetical protein
MIPNDIMITKQRDVALLKTAFDEMKKLDSVMVKLQSSDVNLSDVRKMFDSCVKAFPAMAGYLAPDAAIVHRPDFEAGLVKLIRGETLGASDIAALENFKRTEKDEKVV